MLGQLDEAGEEQVELRLLTDAEYAEESDIIVDELIDEYIEGKTPPAELRQFEEYFLRSRARQEKFSFALALKKRAAQRRWTKRLYRFYLPAAAAAALLIGIGVITWRVFQRQSEVSEGLAVLHAAYREQRPVEERLSGFGYAAAPQLRGGGEKFDRVQREYAARLLTGAVTKRPTAEAHAALGQYYLAVHQFDDAINELNAALSLDPNNAKTHSDLGVALMERGRLNTSGAEGDDAARDFFESLRHFNKALELDNSLTEPLFDRALLYQYMKLPSQAEEDWHSYLDKDPASPWAAEAQQKLRALEEQKNSTSLTDGEILREFRDAYGAKDEETAWNVVSSYHNRTGNVVFEQALDSYIDAAAGGRGNEADAGLGLLSYIGDLEARKAGDHFFSDLTHFYGAAPPDRLAELAGARATMKAAHDGWGKVAAATSLSQFGEARELFEQSGDTCEATFAGYWVSFSLYQQHNTEQGLAVLRPLLELSDARRYEWLAVRALYLSSILQYDLTNYSQAIELAERSLNLAERTGDAVGELNALSSLIEYYRYLNNLGRSLAYVGHSLPLLKVTTLDPIQGCRHYGFVATSLAASGFYEAAADYQKEALRYAFNTGRPATISYNLAFLGQIDAKLKKFDEALDAAGRAFRMAEEHADDPAERDRMAYSSLQMGHIYRQAGDFDKAVESYSRSVRLYEGLDYHTQLYQAHKGMLLCYVAQGNDALAEQEMSKAVGLIESYRDKIFDEGNRDTFFDAEQSVYDIAIGFVYSKLHSPERAFEYSESSRARSLLDLMHSDVRVLKKGLDPDLVFKGGTRSLSLAEIEQRMPERAQVLQFALLEDRVLVWVVSREGVTSTSVPVSRKELQEKADAYLRLLSSPSSGGEADASRLAGELYDVLVKPVEPFLDKTKQVCIVPDKILNRIPFGALISQASGRYLVEDYTLTLAPSATMFVVCSEMVAARGPVSSERILGVGNPRFDRAAYPSLQDLPSASREAAQVASLYDSRRVLVEDEADVRRVTDELANADVVHLALHSVLDERFPMRSKFLLSKPRMGETQSAEDALFAYDIYGLRLPRTRLAVLSACETGGGRYFEGEGVINMARPFIAAGVPLVVTSLWPVDSDPTAELMIDFHRLRKRAGLTSAEALRGAQLAMLRGNDELERRPYYWAPFTLIGGYATF